MAGRADSNNQTQPSAPNAPAVVKHQGPKHTPGPWTADTISMETGDWGVSQRDLRISICHVHNAASFGDFIAGAMKRGGGRFEQCDAVTQIANARLIAAAPDMYDALKLAIGHIEHMAAFFGGKGTGYSFESLGEDMPGIRTALFKAGAA